MKAWILAVLLAVLVGCGGGSDEDDPVPPVRPPDCRQEVCR